MNKFICLIISAFVLISCKNTANLTAVKFKTILNNSDGKSKKVNVSMKIPHNYTIKSYFAGNEWNAKEYWYADSSVIYITSEKGIHTLNYENVRRIKGAAATRFLSKDTMSLTGKTQKNLYWKDIKLKELNIGYTNVPKNKKELFDKALESIKKKCICPKIEL